MRRLAIGVSAAVLLVAILLGPSLLAPGPRGLTWLELTEGATGRRIFAGALADGEEIVLTWKNSLFGLTPHAASRPAMTAANSLGLEVLRLVTYDS